MGSLSAYILRSGETGNTETPLYDELEAKWAEQYYQRAICEQYWTVTHTATGQEWLEDDEGNEVFPEPPTQTDLNEGVDLSAYIVPNEVRVGDTVIPIKLGEPQYAEGGLVEPVRTFVYKPDEGFAVPKRKFKLFGRNQGTNGTL